MAQASTTSAANDLAADELEEAWDAMRDAFHHAMHQLRDDPAYGRLDAYVAQVFDPDSRMLGMQSVDAWIGEAVQALRGEGADDDC